MWPNFASGIVTLASVGWLAVWIKYVDNDSNCDSDRLEVCLRNRKN